MQERFTSHVLPALGRDREEEEEEREEREDKGDSGEIERKQNTHRRKGMKEENEKIFRLLDSSGIVTVLPVFTVYALPPQLSKSFCHQ